ncbi:hypothetical protein HGM15179_003379 [Zosterops borbonicus]|uniref:Uncharacterized protein n=1 Tax=Zosterops borbonicus TaxID=364589 RepID=A0A8K1GSV5_9PASS|nr:hypothetical protein HGM15179_003379 [Zosterops borbonicus]
MSREMGMMETLRLSSKLARKQQKADTSRAIQTQQSSNQLYLLAWDQKEAQTQMGLGKRDISRDISDIGQSRAGDDNLRDVSTISKAISIDVRAEVSSSKTKFLLKNYDKKEKRDKLEIHGKTCSYLKDPQRKDGLHPQKNTSNAGCPTTIRVPKPHGGGDLPGATAQTVAQNNSDSKMWLIIRLK